MKTGTIDTSWHWNRDFLVESNGNGSIVLRNDLTGALIALSQAEYDILQAYDAGNDYEFVQDVMTEYDISQDAFNSVIQMAQQFDILISGKSDSAAAAKKRRQSVLKMKLIYLANRFVSLLQHFTRQPLSAECTGNLRFFKLCSIDLKGSLLYRLATDSRFQKIIPATYAIAMTVLIIVSVCNIGSFQFAGFAMNHVKVWLLFIAMFASICCSLMWHECGHYLIYKRYGGNSDRMGIGTLFGFFPVLYTHVGQLHLWTDRRRRLLLTSAGILADTLALLTVIAILSLWHKACFVNLLIDCMFFYYIMQTATNLNIFIPGTDGYYIFEELSGLERLYGRSFETAQTFWKRISGFHRAKLSIKQWLEVIYFVICCICITLYWAFAVLWITFPIWAGNLF